MKKYAVLAASFCEFDNAATKTTPPENDLKLKFSTA